MPFNLDPVSALGAIEKAKGWQQQSLGGASPMKFSSGLVARSGSDRAVQDIGPFSQEIILPETGVFSSDGVGNILRGQITAYGNAAELGAQALSSTGDVHRSNMQLEFAKELAEKRKKAQEEKERGALGISIGSTIGSIAGNIIAPGIGGSIGGQLGGSIGGLFG